MMDKKKYLEQASQTVEGMKKQVDELILKSKKMQEEMLADLVAQTDILKEKKQKIDEALEALRNASEENWDQFRDEFEHLAGEGASSQFKAKVNEMSEKMTSLAHWAEEHFDTFYSTAKSRVSEWSKKIEELEKEMGEKAENNFKDEMDYLRKKKDEVGEHLGNLSESSGEAWEDVKKGFLDAADSLQKTFHNLFRKS